LLKNASDLHSGKKTGIQNKTPQFIEKLVFVPPAITPIFNLNLVQPGRSSGSFQLACNGKELPFSHLKAYRRCYHDVEFMYENIELKRLTYPCPILESHITFTLGLF
jgi:hypothetical protein